jgi:serine phosphatase RsbU (regulator of sigma subunit)/anti-sigma regulatory factor (Ser/Thr protein kinase)/transposase
MKLFSRPVKEVFAEFPAAESKLPDVRSFIETVLQETPFRRKDITAVLLAIEEACTNVIRHAYLYGEGSLKIKISLFHDRVTLSIYDRGRSFDFEKSSDPDLNHYIKTGRKGGLGIYLIRKVTDEVTYQSSAGVNELRLMKRFARTKPEPATRTDGISLRLKFSLWTSLVMTAVLLVVYFYWENRAVSWREKQFTETVQEYGKAIASQSAGYFINQRSDVEFDEFVRNFAAQNPDVRYIYLLDSHGNVVASTGSSNQLHTRYPVPQSLDPTLVGKPQVLVDDAGRHVFYIIEEIVSQNRKLGALHVGFGEERLSTNIASTRLSIIVVVGIAFLFIIGAVYLLANYFVRPIQKLIEGVRRFGKGDLESKIAIQGADEFGAIAKAFNEMTVKFKEAQANVVEQERMRKEMQVAQDIQQTLLPKQFPDIEGFDIATIYRAAKDVGGDYYDFFWIDQNTLGIVVADVAGKGVPGSLVMTMIRTAIRLESRGNRSPVDILTKVNEFVTEDVRKGMFITIFLVVLDTRNRKISFSSAGHNPMVLYRKDEDKTFFLNPKGIPLGINLPEGVSFEENLVSESVRLKKGDMLVIYTDGITEAMDPKRSQYGVAQFLEFIKDNSDLSPDEFVEKFSDELHRFTSGAEQNDDITMVVIKERIEADEYIFARRKKLLELVDVERRPIAEACRLMNLSTSTYYRYKKRFEVYGDEGLLNKELRIDDSPAQLTYQQRNQVLEIIKRNPDLGATRIRRELESLGNGNAGIEDKTIYAELVRLRLNTKRQRYDFALRFGGSLTLQQQEEFGRLTEADQTSQPIIDRQVYVGQIRESLARQEDSRAAVWKNRLEEMGLNEDKSDVLTAMFEEMEGQVSAEQLRLLFERVTGRVRQMDRELEKQNVISTARLDELDEGQWAKRADDGITLEVIDLPATEPTLDFDEYGRKLVRKNRKETDE